jgi:hypothetical protein
LFLRKLVNLGRLDQIINLTKISCIDIDYDFSSAGILVAFACERKMGQAERIIRLELSEAEAEAPNYEHYHHITTLTRECS